MGFFSVKFNDTKKSMCNEHTDKPSRDFYLYHPNGEKIKIDYYNGYGKLVIAPGVDIDYHEFLAVINGYKKDRNIGIKLECEPENRPQGFKPLVICESNQYKYSDFGMCESDPNQGFWVEDDEPKQRTFNCTFKMFDKDSEFYIPESKLIMTFTYEEENRILVDGDVEFFGNGSTQAINYYLGEWSMFYELLISQLYEGGDENGHFVLIDSPDDCTTARGKTDPYYDNDPEIDELENNPDATIFAEFIFNEIK